LAARHRATITISTISVFALFRCCRVRGRPAKSPHTQANSGKGIIDMAIAVP